VLSFRLLFVFSTNANGIVKQELRKWELIYKYLIFCLFLKGYQRCAFYFPSPIAPLQAKKVTLEESSHQSGESMKLFFA